MSSGGIVFDIQKFSVHDGPGIRTTVFLKGCPLRCVWCHNPESWHGEPEILFSEEKCTLCGECMKKCSNQCHLLENGSHTFKRANCKGCGLCSASCLSEALELCGNVRTPEHVMKEVLKDRPFYENSGGGMTLSGGEPMMQFEFTLGLLKLAKENGIHVCMETCGFASKKHYADVIPYVDIFLFDIKTVDPVKHLRFTGQDIKVIHENLFFLDAHNAEIELRCPLIPGMNDSETELRGIGALSGRLKNVSGIVVEPYHPLGVSKGRRLGLSGGFEAPFAQKEISEAWVKKIAGTTIVKVSKQ